MASERLRRVQSHVRPAAAAAATPPIELWTKAGSAKASVGDCPFSHGVAMALKLQGCEFVYRAATEATKPPWLLEAGGGLPTLRCGDQTVTDSTEILAFIDRRFGGAGSQQLCTPTSDAALAETAGVMGAIAGCIRAGSAEAAGATAALITELGKVEQLLAASDGPWLGGSTYSFSICSRQLPVR